MIRPLASLASMAVLLAASLALPRGDGSAVAQSLPPAPHSPVRTCINMGNALEAPNEGEWGPRITREDIRAIAAQGFDTLRLPVAWSEHLDDRNRIDPAFLARVDEVARWALAEDLQIIVNVHNYWALNEDPATHIPRLHAIWGQLSRHYADWPDGLIFEIVNEPSEAFTQDLVNQVNAEALAGIRRTNPDRWVVLGGAHWGTIEPFTAETANPFVPPPDTHRVLTTFHSYTPFEFTHQGAHFTDDPPPMGRKLRPMRDRLLIRSEMREAANFRARTGLPIFLGEFGPYIRTLTPDERATWTRIMREEAEGFDIPWCYFDWQTEFAYVDQATKRPLPGLRAALFGAER